MGSYFTKKVAKAGGDASQVQLVRFGGERAVNGVKVHSVPAVHSNGLSPAFLEGTHAEALEANGLTAYLGPPGGYVVEFTNGLTVYLRSEEHTSELQSLMRISYAVFCLKKKKSLITEDQEHKQQSQTHTASNSILQ